MTGDVVYPDIPGCRLLLFQQKLYGRGAIEVLGKDVDTHQTLSVFIRDASALQKRFQAARGENDPFLMVGQHPAIQDMDAYGRVAKLAYKRKPAKMIDMAMSDEYLVDISQGDMFPIRVS